jgi:hypothetical protein
MRIDRLGPDLVALTDIVRSLSDVNLPQFVGGSDAAAFLATLPQSMLPGIMRQVDELLNRRADPGGLEAGRQQRPIGGANYDVFVAYSRQDRAWVRELAGDLQAKRVSVAYDELAIGPGNVVVHMLNEAIRASASGLLVYSRAAIASRWVAEEYAALMQQAIHSGQRLIPVLIEDVPLPPLAQSLLLADFSGIDAAGYDQLVHQIAAAVARSLPVREALSSSLPVLSLDRRSSGFTLLNPFRDRAASKYSPRNWRSPGQCCLPMRAEVLQGARAARRPSNIPRAMLCTRRGFPPSSARLASARRTG